MTVEQCDAAGIDRECAGDPLADPHVAITICAVFAVALGGGVGYAIFKMAMAIAA